MSKRKLDSLERPKGGFVDTIRRKPERLTIPAFLVFVLLSWEFGTRLFHVPVYVVPSPSLVWNAFISGWTSGIFARHTLVTLHEVFFGFGLAAVLGLIFGGVVAQWKLVERTLLPYLVGIETIPKIALAPIIIVWLGFGSVSKIGIAGLVAFFPVLVNTIQGLMIVDQNKLDLLRSIGANGWQTFWKLKAPNALPMIFTGLDTASVLCILGAITGEFVGSRAGLGNLILHYQFMMDIPSFFGVIITLGLFGLIFHTTIRFAERRIVFWTHHHETDVTISM